MIKRLLVPVSLCLFTIACNQATPPPPAAAAAADSGPKASDVFDKTLSSVEKEFISLIEAMPADKFDFAPTKGKFDGVRNFGAQAKHVGAVLNLVSASLLGEPSPGNENGPADMKTKDQIVQYVKDAFAHAHKAVATATGATLLQELPESLQRKIEDDPRGIDDGDVGPHFRPLRADRRICADEQPCPTGQPLSDPMWGGASAPQAGFRPARARTLLAGR